MFGSPHDTSNAGRGASYPRYYRILVTSDDFDSIYDGPDPTTEVDAPLPESSPGWLESRRDFKARVGVRKCRANVDRRPPRRDPKGRMRE